MLKSLKHLLTLILTTIGLYIKDFFFPIKFYILFFIRSIYNILQWGIDNRNTVCSSSTKLIFIAFSVGWNFNSSVLIVYTSGIEACIQFLSTGPMWLTKRINESVSIEIESGTSPISSPCAIGTPTEDYNQTQRSRSSHICVSTFKH